MKISGKLLSAAALSAALFAPVFFAAGFFAAKTRFAPRPTVAATIPGATTETIFLDGKKTLVFRRPFGFSHPTSLRGEDVALVTAMIPAGRMSTAALVEKALKAVFAGPSVEEAAAGCYSMVPPGAAVDKIIFADGRLIADFSPQFAPSGGSLAALQARLAVEETVRQFPEIKELEIKVAGKPYLPEP